MSRKTASITLILAITALLFSDDIKAATATQEIIEQLENELNAAIMDQDEAALNRLLAAEYTTDGIQTLTKSEQISQIMSSIPPRTQTIDSMSVKLHGDTAVVSGVETAEWLNPAGMRSNSYSWVNVWVHGENGWQVVFSQSVNVGPPGMSGDGC